MSEATAFLLSLLVPSARLWTSLPVIVPSLMFLPVITSAAVAVPLNATNRATSATTSAGEGRLLTMLLIWMLLWSGAGGAARHVFPSVRGSAARQVVAARAVAVVAVPGAGGADRARPAQPAVEVGAVGPEGVGAVRPQLGTAPSAPALEHAHVSDPVARRGVEGAAFHPHGRDDGLDAGLVGGDDHRRLVLEAARQLVHQVALPDAGLWNGRLRRRGARDGERRDCEQQGE